MALEQLVHILDEQITVYRQLLEVVRREKDILISANLDDLSENNKLKETQLIKIRGLETERIRVAAQLATSLGLSPEAPRLLEIANHLSQEGGDKLRTMHSVLELLVRRIQDLNQKNEVLVQSALANVTGAMTNLKNVLEEQKTYKRKGDLGKAQTISGQLVSKEA